MGPTPRSSPPCVTVNGRDEPYSLRGLAAFVELPRLASRRTAEIRTDGRNVETFDRPQTRRVDAVDPLAHRPERPANVFGEELRLFPGCKMPANVMPLIVHKL